MNDKRKDSWPKRIYVNASESTGKMYGHLDPKDGREEYVLASWAFQDEKKEGDA